MILAYSDSEFQKHCIKYYIEQHQEQVFWLKRDLSGLLIDILFSRRTSAIYLGDIRSLKQILIVILMPRTIPLRLFDDGLYSIWLIHAINQKKTLSFNWIKDILIRRFILSRANIEFFTRFAREEHSLLEGRFKVKNLNYHADVDCNKKTASFSLVVGSDYTELSIIDCQEYKSILSMVSGENIYYYPHRKENNATFGQKLPPHYKTIDRNDMNIMSFLGCVNYLPETVYLFYSTAIVEIIEKYPQIKIQILEINTKSKYTDMLRVIEAELRHKLA